MNDNFINEVLPNCVDVIKITWYESLKVPRQVFSVAETPSNVSLLKKITCNLKINNTDMGL